MVKQKEEIINEISYWDYRYTSCLTVGCSPNALKVIKQKKNIKWKWIHFNELHIRQVKSLKEYCKNLPYWPLPTEDNELILETDASEEHWSGVLKIKDNPEKISKYASGLFSNTEKNIA